MFGLFKPAVGEESCRTDVYKNVSTSPLNERLELICSFKKKISMVMQHDDRLICDDFVFSMGLEGSYTVV